MVVSLVHGPPMLVMSGRPRLVIYISIQVPWLLYRSLILSVPSIPIVLLSDSVTDRCETKYEKYILKKP